MINPTTLIFFYGKGGAGKDTVGKQMIADNPTWTGVSTGDEIKAALNDPAHRHHRKVKPYLEDVRNGINLPDSVVINLDSPRDGIYSEFVEDQLATGSPVIISTGFPRTLSQLHLLNEYIRRQRESLSIVDHHFYLDVTDQTTRERIARRRQDYIAAGKEPRVDDDPAVVERRLKVFANDTMPIVDHLSLEGRVHIIGAEGTPDEINGLVIAELFPKPPLEISHPGRERM